MAFLDPNKKYLEQYWHELYVEMLSNPDDKRTDKQFCEEIGIDNSTLTRWKSKYRLQIFEEVQKRRTQYINNIRNILQRALIKKVELGDTNAIKLGFQLIGDLVEKHENKMFGMDRNDKEKRLFNLLGEIGKKAQNWDKANKSAENRKEETNGDSQSLGNEPGTDLPSSGS